MLVAIGETQVTVKNGVVNVYSLIGAVKIGLLISRNVRTGVIHLALAADGKVLYDGHIGGEHDAKAS